MNPKKNLFLFGLLSVVVVVAVLVLVLYHSDSIRSSQRSESNTAPKGTPPVAAVAPVPRNPLSMHAVNDIEAMLKSDDAALRNQGGDLIRQLALKSPDALAANLSHWTKHLVDSQQFDLIESVTRVAILQDASNTSMVSDAQRARVQALIGLGRFDDAVIEGKSLFNVATLKTTDAAIDLLSAALMNARGAGDPKVVDRFKTEQIAGASVVETSDDETLLRSIKVDSGPYLSAIETAKVADDYTHLMARGNLYLLADQPSEARLCFAHACNLPEVKGKNLFAAVEGIVRCARAESGCVGPANAVLAAIRVGAVSSPKLASLDTTKVTADELQIAGKRIDAAKLPSSFGAVSAVPTTHPDLVSGRMLRVIAMAQGVDSPDSDLVAWLKELQSANASTSIESRKRLASILSATHVGSDQLFQLAKAFHLASNDAAASTVFYRGAADHATSELSNSNVSEEKKLAILHAMNDCMEDYKELLWPLIDKVPRDEDALSTLYRTYSNLVKFTVTSDPALATALTHVKIGLAECVYLSGNNDEALAILHSLDMSKMSNGERSAHSWALGLVLYKARNFHDAAVQIHAVAEDKQSPHRNEALKLEIMAWARAGDADQARGAYKAWLDSVSPTGEQASATESTMNQYIQRYRP